MNSSNTVAVALACCVLLWWWPKRITPPSRTSTVDVWNDARALRFLLSNNASAQTLTQSLTALEKVTWVPTPEVAERLKALAVLNAESGISVTAALEQLHFEADSEDILKRMWNEKAAVAYTSSNALVLLSVGMVILTSNSGSLQWLLSTSIGRLCCLLSVLLTFISRRSLVRAQRRALSRARKPALRTLPIDVLVPVMSAVPVLFAANAVGLALSICVWIFLREFLPRLPSSADLDKQSRPDSDYIWLLCLLQCAVSAGHDWLQSFEIASRAVAKNFKQEISPVIQRLQWGLPIEQVFVGAEWQELARISEQVQRLGVRIESGLEVLREDLNQRTRSSRIQNLERVAATSVIPVSLLQLPAFIALSVVPVLATELSTFFSDFLSTSI